MNCTDNRQQAVQTLINAIKHRYPDKGFYLSDSVHFINDVDKGMCVMAKEKIPKDANVMVLCQDIFDMVTVELNPKLIKDLRNGLDRNEQSISLSKIELHRHMIPPDDILLAVAIMKIASRKSRTQQYANDLKVLQAATWPSEQELKESSWLYWENSDVRSVCFQSGIHQYYYLSPS